MLNKLIIRDLKLILVLWIIFSFISIVRGEPILNTSNNSLEINITGENINEAGHAALNKTLDAATKAKDTLPNKVHVKLPGYDAIMFLFALTVAYRKIK